MPPFNKMTPKPPTHAHAHAPTPFVVQVPICEWCKRDVGRKCPACTRITCYRCLASLEGGLCVHYPYTPVTSDGWGQECPNPHCDIDCNLCMGTGMIHSALQRRLGRGHP